MFRCLYRPASSLSRASRIPSARHLHRVTADFSKIDSRGSLVTEKVPVVVGNPGETYIMIDPEVGSAIRAGQSPVSALAASTEDTCKLTFFHDSQHFGFESSGYPRLYTPNHIARLTNSNTSPATLFLSGIMHEIVLDGTPDAQFAIHARASLRALGSELDRLKDM